MVTTPEEMADQMKAAIPGFAHVPAMHWREEAVRHHTELSDHVGLTFDPALREAFDAARAAPLPELWPLFETCAGLPLALITAGRPTGWLRCAPAVPT